MLEGKAPEKWLSRLRADLIENGVVVPNDRFLVFMRDEEFSSPSTAADIIAGVRVSGPTHWKTEGGITLKELDAQD